MRTRIPKSIKSRKNGRTKNKKRHFELSHLLHGYHEVHNDKDIYEKKSPYDGMLIEHPFYLDSNEILNLDLQRGHSFKPFVIQGSAGMGKTVVMTQIGLQYVTRIKRMLDYDGIGDMSFIPFPIFIKGRNVSYSELRNTYELESLILESNPDLSKYEGIIPCGVTDAGVTSASDLGYNFSLKDFDNSLALNFEKLF